MNRNSSPKSVCLGELSTGRRLARRLRSWSRGRYRPNDEQDEDIPVRGVSRLEVSGSEDEDCLSEADGMSVAGNRELVKRIEDLQKQIYINKEDSRIREREMEQKFNLQSRGRNPQRNIRFKAPKLNESESINISRVSKIRLKIPQKDDRRRWIHLRHHSRCWGI